MRKSIISEVVRTEIAKAVGGEVLEESVSISDVFIRTVDSVKGAFFGGVGGATIGAVGYGILSAIFWGLGLTNPATLLGVGFFAGGAIVAKVGMAAGVALGTFIGATGQLEESEQQFEESFGSPSSVVATLSNKAVKTVKARDKYLEKVAKDPDIAEKTKNEFDKLTRNIIKAFTDLDRAVKENRNIMSREEYNAFMKVNRVGMEGKISYLNPKK